MIWNDQHEDYGEGPEGPSPAFDPQPDPDSALDIPVALGASLRRLVKKWRKETDWDSFRHYATTADQLERVLREWHLS